MLGERLLIKDPELCDSSSSPSEGGEYHLLDGETMLSEAERAEATCLLPGGGVQSQTSACSLVGAPWEDNSLPVRLCGPTRGNLSRPFYWAYSLRASTLSPLVEIVDNQKQRGDSLSYSSNQLQALFN